MARPHQLTINGNEFRNYTYLNIKKSRNKLGYFEFVINNPNSTNMVDIAYNKLVIFNEFNPATQVYDEKFRGYIRNIDRQTQYQAKVSGYSPGIKLFDRTWTDRDDSQFDNTATNTIVSTLASGIINVGTNAITKVISIRFELDNRLRSLAQIANLNGAEWWTDVSGGNDRINIDTTRYSSTSAGTITVGRQSYITSDVTNAEQIYNCITVLGRGDGVNQVKAFSYGFCAPTALSGTAFPTLNTAITQTSTDIIVSDVTGFSATNGIIYINNEKIKYATRSGTTLQTCTVWNGSAFVTRALPLSSPHSAGMRIWYAGTTTTEFTKDSPASGSSVTTYGIREYTYYDQSILQNLPLSPATVCDVNETAGIVATLFFDKFQSPVRTVTAKFTKVQIGSYDVGKTVTIVDSKMGISQDFKIEEMEYNYGLASGETLVFVMNNQFFNYLTNLDELKKNMDTTGVYGQGATNIYQVSGSENVDSDFPMNLRFFVPPETVAINSLKLNFKMKNYRADSKSIALAPKFSQNFSAFYSEALAFNVGNLTSTSVLTSVTALTSTQFLKTTGSIHNDYNPEIFVDNIDGGGNVTSFFSVGGSEIFTSSDDGFLKSTAMTGITSTATSVVKSGTAGTTYSSPIGCKSIANDLSGTFDRIKIFYTVFNGDPSSSRTPTIVLSIETSPGSGSYTTIHTRTPTIGSRQFYVDEAEVTSDKRGCAVDISITTASFNVNQTTYADLSYILLNVITYIKNDLSLTYGIFENTSEFTPPGEVVITVKSDGGSTLGTIGTYTSNQTNVDLTVDSVGNLIDFRPNTYYNIEIDPSPSSYNGRMRIEALASIQIYIESKVVD